MTTQGINHDPTLDFLPRRFVAQKRVIAIALVMIVAAVVLRFVVVRQQEAELDELRSQTLAMGMAWSADELNASPVLSDDRNAATYYRLAFQTRSQTVESYSSSNYDDLYAHYSQSPLFYYLADAAAEANQQAFAHARKAREQEHIAWGVTFNPGAPLNIGGHYQHMRALANELGDNAMLLQFRGHDRLALDRIRDTQGIARHLGTEKTLIGQLVCTGVHALALHRLQSIAPLLRTDDPEVAADVRRMIDELETAEADYARNYPRGLQGEDVQARSLIERLGNGTFLSRPLFNAATIDRSRSVLAVTRSWSGQEVDSKDVGLSESQAHRRVAIETDRSFFTLGPPLYPHAYLSQMFGMSYNRAYEASRRTRQEFRLTRVMLASRLFYVDQKRWPSTIDELVPRYLREVPAGVDAMEGARVELTIIPQGLPDGSDRPMIYVDFRNSNNPPPLSGDATGWQYGSPSDGWDEDGRQWRDLTVWPIAAHMKREGYGGRSSYDPWGESGFEASGLEPSAHSPGAIGDPDNPDAPWDEN